MALKSRLGRYWYAQDFDPGPLGLVINPYFLARRALWDVMAGWGRATSGGRLLDVGCGQQPYRVHFDVAEYVGLELDTPAARARDVADVYYDGGRFPFPDGRFDVVLCNQVLEHVFHPDDFVAELRRVLVPGGRLFLTVPFVWDEHEQPHDFARYSSFGLAALLERNGFAVREHRKLLADASVLFQLANAYVFKVLPRRHRFLTLLLTVLLAAPITAVGLLARRFLPANPDLFLDHAVVAEAVA